MQKPLTRAKFFKSIFNGKHLLEIGFIVVYAKKRTARRIAQLLNSKRCFYKNANV